MWKVDFELGCSSEATNCERETTKCLQYESETTKYLLRYHNFFYLSKDHTPLYH